VATVGPMSSRAKILLGVVMTLSLLCGFLHEIWPNAPLSFKRLHIFGFNLLTGGSLILYHIVGKFRSSCWWNRCASDVSRSSRSTSFVAHR